MTLQRWQPVSSCTITWMEICDIGQWVRADEAEAEIAFLAKRGDDLAEKLTRFTKHCGVERLQDENERLRAAIDTMLVAFDYDGGRQVGAIFSAKENLKAVLKGGE